MNTEQSGAAHRASEPRRPLHTNFTQQTLRQAVRAKRRANTKQQFLALLKERPSMKSFKILRTVPGAVAAVAVVAAGSVGAYALSNWFNGNVTVKQNTSIFSVDLSSCKGNLPPGVNRGSDPGKVQFKILGSPHISAADLRQNLLGVCERDAITDFYGKQLPDTGFSSTGHPTTPSHSFQYMLLAGTITDVSDGTVTLASGPSVKGQSLFTTQKFALATNATVYMASKLTPLNSLKTGDKVLFVLHSASATVDHPGFEGTDILDYSDTQVISLFKTQFDDDKQYSSTYDQQNIMPLDEYNSLPNHQPYAK